MIVCETSHLTEFNLNEVTLFNNFKSLVINIIMKSLFIILAMMAFYVNFANAQDKGRDSTYKRFSNPDFFERFQDSLHKSKPLKLDLYTQKNDFSVAIPNAYSKNENVIYNMPIKNLSGKGLAPMPGTENLDKIDNKSLKDLKSKGKQ